MPATPHRKTASSARKRKAPGERARGIERLVGIFAALHERRAPMSVRELVGATGAPRSSVYDLVTRLSKADWLEMDPNGKVFFGRAVHFYGLDYADHNDLIKRSRPVMRRLSAAFNETTQLCALDADKYTVLLNEHGAGPFVVSSEIGVKVPIPWTASGRLLLQGLTHTEVLGLIPKADFVLPNGTPIDPGDFLGEIDKARFKGYAMTEGLVDSFACCMAAPVTDERGRVVAALCFTVGRDATKTRRGALLKALTAAAHSLSH
ncbi:MAG TPA: IclR family transcriptional regulator [Rhodanobacteraceae bacterium]|nr:IclR family transcriptional regulator [Rhodanobacteraceae bacterium]